MRKYWKWHDNLIDRLASNKEEAIGYLDVALEEYQQDGVTPFFLKSICNVVEAQGGLTELAKRTYMSPDALQEIFSADKAPPIDTFGTILNALGCRLSIEPLDSNIAFSESAAEQ